MQKTWAILQVELKMPQKVGKLLLQQQAIAAIQVFRIQGSLLCFNYSPSQIHKLRKEILELGSKLFQRFSWKCLEMIYTVN